VVCIEQPSIAAGVGTGTALSFIARAEASGTRSVPVDNSGATQQVPEVGNVNEQVWRIPASAISTGRWRSVRRLAARPAGGDQGAQERDVVLARCQFGGEHGDAVAQRDDVGLA